MKKLLNDPSNAVSEMIEGLVMLNPGLQSLKGQNVIVRRDFLGKEQHDRVTLISGGGSGHEPSHAGYIGKGMLTAAVLGDVFASPTSAQVLAAIKHVAGPKGVLLIIKAYTGDRLNFGIAAELARGEGIQVETVIVGDDCALLDNPDRATAGRRGLAGTVLVHKIAGALADTGASLREVADVARRVADGLGTMGVGLSPCIIPAVGKPGFTLGDDEMELGLGIHGEQGRERTTLKHADDVVVDLLSSILNTAPAFKGKDLATLSVILLINNLGCTTAMEMAVIARKALQYLSRDRGMTVVRVYNGYFMTALDMQGASLTLLPYLDGGGDKKDDDILSLLDHHTDAPGWPRTSSAAPYVDQITVDYKGKDSQSSEIFTAAAVPAESRIPSLFKQFLEKGTSALISSADHLTELDSKVGDGDLGISMEKASKSLLSAYPSWDLSTPAQSLHSLALTLQVGLGGTSGPLYTIFFLRFAASLEASLKAGNSYSDAKVWAQAVSAAANGIQEIGGAKVGDCTLLDALLPAVASLSSQLEGGASAEDALAAAANAAEEGARSTIDMIPKKGRASYLGERARGHVDPGAQAVAILFRSLVL